MRKVQVKQTPWALVVPLFVLVGITGALRFSEERQSRPVSPEEFVHHRPAASSENLVEAVEQGDRTRAEILLSDDVNPNSVRELHFPKGMKDDPNLRSQGNPVLEIAARSGDTEMVQLLLDRGADINARGRFGYTALMAAAQGGYVSVVQLLLEKGADPDLVSTTRHETALHLTIPERPLNPDPQSTESLQGFAPSMDRMAWEQMSKQEQQQYMEQAHAKQWVSDVNQREVREKICRLLLDAGADPTVPNKWGKTAADAAEATGYKEMAKMIRDARSNRTLSLEKPGRLHRSGE
ncbi:MAG: hypothetical protein OHK0029_42070 [Armatimonadaceae bacterium]